MSEFAKLFWLLVCSFLFNLFGFIARYIRFRTNWIACDNTAMESVVDGFGKKEVLPSGFQFGNSKDSCKSNGETEDSVLVEAAPTPSTSKYQFISGRDVRGFVEEPQTMSFSVQELFVFRENSEENVENLQLGSNISSIAHDSEDFQKKSEGNVQSLQLGSNISSIAHDSEDLGELDSKADDVDKETAEYSVESPFAEQVSQKQEQVSSTGDKQLTDLVNNSLGKANFFNDLQLLSEKHFWPSDCKSELSIPYDGFSNGSNGIDATGEELSMHGYVNVLKPDPLSIDEKQQGFTEKILINDRIDSGGEDIFRDRHADGGLKPDPILSIDEQQLGFTDNIPMSEENSVVNAGFSDREPNDTGGKAEDTDDEYIELVPNLHSSSVRHESSSSEKDPAKVTGEHEVDGKSEFVKMETKEGDGNSKESEAWRKLWDPGSEDEDGFEILREHQDLIEQMKMELKNARTGGLPTILEESETPKMMEDLKPLKIDEKLEHKDRIEEIQKFYKSYAERMRKLDILNYQTMHAISFLQLKDTNQLAYRQKDPVSTVKSIIFLNFWPGKLRRIYVDPTLKSISESQRDLELVYVGQLCLSWEILNWQYGKAKELREHESQGHHSYTQVTCEFQQFQVLMQRFVEDEQFQGPRVQNYVKNRRVLGTLLQIPSIRDDCLKANRETRAAGEDAVSIEMLTEIIKESIYVFWEFLRADKHQANVIKGFQGGSGVDLQDPSDAGLLMDIKASLQKKERRLKDIMRSGNCVVKKLRKQQEGRCDQTLLLAQIELRLVWRVLNLSRLTTDQLVWCQKKLDRINFINREIHAEPFFLLFPF